jgi:hypothetical protein
LLCGSAHGRKSRGSNKRRHEGLLMNPVIRRTAHQSLYALLMLLTSSVAQAAFIISDNLAGNTAFSNTERAILHQAQQHWESRIGNLMAQGRENFTITYTKSDTLGARTLALARDFEADNDGVPLRANVFVNQNLEGSNDSFLDTTPGDNNEYMGVQGFPFYFTARQGVVDPGTGFSVSTLYDFYSTALHEIGHAIGFTAQYSRFADKLGAPMPESVRQFLFANGDFAVLTVADDGTHTKSDQTGLFKTDEYDQNHDMMNPIARPGERLLPSDFDIAMLVEAFGYKLPQVPEPGTSALLACACFVIVRARVQRIGRGAATGRSGRRP